MQRRALFAILLVPFAVLAGWAVQHLSQDVPAMALEQRRPTGIMGTSCNLMLLTGPAGAAAARQGLATAESELRRLEALLSTWIEDSQISRFNAATTRLPQPISPEGLDVLRAARRLHTETRGAFDITIRPLILLWREAAALGLEPSAAALAAARQESTWQQIQIGHDGASKAVATTTVDIDGLAKGYAIDRAARLLEDSGADGGMVEIGGDLRVFGSGPENGRWVIAIQNPFASHPWGEIALRSGAVCTSGDYARFQEIGGQRFSHIIDPRSGRPAQATPSVTVIGPDALTADAWATALSVLGPEGLELLTSRPDLQAMMVVGGPDSYRIRATERFRHYLGRAEFELTD